MAKFIGVVIDASSSDTALELCHRTILILSIFRLKEVILHFSSLDLRPNLQGSAVLLLG